MTVALVFVANLLLVAAIVGLVHWLGRSITARLDSAESAKTLFLAEFPTETVTEITITGAGDGALLALQGQGAIGLVSAMGMHWLVRRIEQNGVAGASVEEPSQIVLRLAEFTAPRLVLDLGNAAQALRWRDRLLALAHPAPP